MSGQAFQERMNMGGQAYIAGLANTAKALWVKACEHDGIPPDSSFVVFSDDNPWVPLRDKAMRGYWAAKREYQAGGYVGLRIQNGRASI